MPNLTTIPTAEALAGIPLLANEARGDTALSSLLAGRDNVEPPPTQQAPLTKTATPSTSKDPDPLLLSVLFPPIPGKLVEKIRSGAFVDMQELLPDNIDLLKQLDSLQHDRSTSKAKLREVKSLPTWMYCFLAYMAVATNDPRTREMLTYARLVIREALRTGGDGWGAYDRLFREHMALDKGKTMCWSTLQPGLHQTTFMRHGDSKGGTTCTVCNESDHTAATCALASIRNPPSSKRESSPPPPKRPRPNPPKGSYRPNPETIKNICKQYNRYGSCKWINTERGCKMDHICATCSDPYHLARDCALTPSDSIYKMDQPQRWSKPKTG